MCNPLVFSNQLVNMCRGTATVALAVVALLWSGMTAAKLFTKRSPVLEDHLYLIAYPCFLMYSAFALLSIY
jgi:hypothetical protein